MEVRDMHHNIYNILYYNILAWVFEIILQAVQLDGHVRYFRAVCIHITENTVGSKI
jgi:hypothetical protein